MKKQLSKQIAIGVCIIALLGLSLTGFNQQASSRASSNDTTPKPRERKVRSLDDALQELDRQSIELDLKLKNLTIPSFDGEKMQAELEKAMKNIDEAKLKMELKDFKFDSEKLKADLEKSMKELDFSKMKIDLKELDKIDGDKIRLEIEKAMKDVDLTRLKEEINASMAKVDFDKMKVDMQRLKEIEMPKLQLEMKEFGPKMEKTMQQARESIEKAKTEIQEYKEFQNSLEKDGLINKDNYSIQHVDGVLKINGKVQPAEVYNKYRTFLDKHKDFEMKKNENGININNTKKD
jgi:hypothetical protein